MQFYHFSVNLATILFHRKRCNEYEQCEKIHIQQRYILNIQILYNIFIIDDYTDASAILFTFTYYTEKTRF